MRADLDERRRSSRRILGDKSPKKRQKEGNTFRIALMSDRSKYMRTRSMPIGRNFGLRFLMIDRIKCKVCCQFKMINLEHEGQELS